MWTLLGIEPINDKKTIKRAYARKLKNHHPEDDPVGFQQLNEAYQDALKASEYQYVQYDYEASFVEAEKNSFDVETVNTSSVFAPLDDEVSCVETKENYTTALSRTKDIPPYADEPDDVVISVEPFLNQLNEFKDEMSLNDWQKLIQDATQLPIFERRQFEMALLVFFYTPVKGYKKTILAAELSPEFFSVIDEHFHWRDNELTLMQGWAGSHEHNSVFLKCLHQYVKPSPEELLEQLEGLLSSPYKIASHKNWCEFFHVACMLNKRQLKGISKKAFQILLTHYHSCEAHLTPAILNAFDRLFGWTWSWAGHRTACLKRPYRQKLVDDTMALADMLIEARLQSATYAQNIDYKKSALRFYSTLFISALGWSVLLAAILFAGPFVQVVAVLYLIRLSIQKIWQVAFSR